MQSGIGRIRRVSIKTDKESRVERYFKREVEKRGGLCKKIIFQGEKGCPDRLVIARNNVHFVELKRPEGKRAAIQEEVHNQFLFRGVHVHTLYDEDEVDNWVREYL